VPTQGTERGADAPSLQAEFRRAMHSAIVGRDGAGGADGPPPRSGAGSASAGGAVNAGAASGGAAAAAAAAAATSPRVLPFRARQPEGFHGPETIAPLAAGGGEKPRHVQSLSRQIPSAPTRILDAPELVDDYYLNLISWSSQDTLAVALNTSVYLWNAATNEVQQLLQVDEGDMVTSVSWDAGGSHIAVGTNSSVVQLWDATSMRKVRTLRGHSARVGSLSWNPDQRSTLSTGGRDAAILQHDVRAPQSRTATLVGHQQEVCGLKWSLDGGVLASGGNENFLCIWDARMSNAGAGGGGGASSQEQTPRLQLAEHRAAVKALAWCPFQRHLLASGGGTADRTIKFWNTQAGTLLNSIDTGSQVCSLLWSKHQREIVSSHGFSHNQICLWKYPSMTKVKEFTGHTARVLHLDQSPDGTCVVSAAADETLRFWKVFDAPKRTVRAVGVASLFAGSQIR